MSIEDRLRLNAPHSVDGGLMTEAANEIQALREHTRAAYAEGWDSGVISGHNIEGRLIDKRAGNPYSIPGEFDE